MLFWALLASGHITIRKSMDGKRSQRSPLFNALISPHEAITSARWSHRCVNFHQLRDTALRDAGKFNGLADR
jgi:hypothetical protein